MRATEPDQHRRDLRGAWRSPSPAILATLLAVGMSAAWVGWLGWHTLAEASDYSAGSVVGLVVTVAAAIAVAGWSGLRPLGTVNAATVGLGVSYWADLSTTAGDGNLFLVGLLLFGTPLYCVALVAALLAESRTDRWRPATTPPAPPDPPDTERQVAAWRAYRDQVIGSD